MTNSEWKRQTFLEATKRLQEKKKEADRKDPARKEYDEGRISWNEYLKRTCKN